MFLRLSGGVKAQQSAKAATMQLMKAEGDVTVSNAKGRALSIMEKMKLYNGYRTDTKEASYAWINLDDEKLTKMDAVSETEIRKNGKKLEILLKSGNLFFDVEEALTEEETLNIRTSTMTVGIRGTSGWAEVIDGMHSKIYILEGTVECTVSDPVSGEVRSATISSGETAEFVVYEEETNGKQCDIIVGSYKEEEIGGFILEELAEKPALCEKIQEASGLKVAEEAKKAGERLAADEEKMGTVLANIRSEYEVQENHISEEPVWVGGGKLAEQPEDVSLSETEEAAADSELKNDQVTTPKQDKTPVNSEIAQPVLQTPTEAVAVAPVPEQKKPEQTESDNKNSSSGNSDGGSGSNNTGGGSGGDNAAGNTGGNETGAYEWYESDPASITVEKIRSMLAEKNNVLIKTSSPSPTTVTVKTGEELTIRSWETLTLQGIDLAIEDRGTIWLHGTLTEKGNLNNKGSVQVGKTGSLKVEGNLNNIEKPEVQFPSGVLVEGKAWVAKNSDLEGGFLNNGGKFEVYGTGHLTIEGNLHNSGGGYGVYLSNTGGADSTQVGKVTVYGDLINDKMLSFNGGGILEVEGTLYNNENASISRNRGKCLINGNIVNKAIISTVGSDNSESFEIAGEVTNEESGHISVGAGDKITKIINKSTSESRVISIVDGTVTDGIYTAGSGDIWISSDAIIRAKELSKTLEIATVPDGCSLKVTVGSSDNALEIKKVADFNEWYIIEEQKSENGEDVYYLRDLCRTLSPEKRAEYQTAGYQITQCRLPD